MIEEITECSERVVTDEHEIGAKCFCDRCEKLIYSELYGKEHKCGLRVNQLFFQVTTGHRDWGNDSCDSVDVRDICSEECLKAEFEDYLEINSDTKYIEIERLTKEVFIAGVK